MLGGYLRSGQWGSVLQCAFNRNNDDFFCPNIADFFADYSSIEVTQRYGDRALRRRFLVMDETVYYPVGAGLGLNLAVVSGHG